MKISIAMLILVAVAAGAFLYFVQEEESPDVYNNENGNNNGNVIEDDMIRVLIPKAGDTVKSPLTVKGEARRNWYFEADFPVSVLDANGKQLDIKPAQAQGEWMTENFVPFEVTLTFTPTTETGTIVLSKHNASGLPEHDDERRIPIKFDLSGVPKKTVNLYYYNPERDKDASGNILCSSKGIVMVQREVSVTITPIQDAIRLLLKGELTNQEKANGITTEFPLAGVSLKAASLSNAGVLTLTFEDPQNATGGGSCRVSVLAAQIEATAKQFKEVKSVRLMPEDLFQP